MAGEMSYAEVTPENYPLHFAVAERAGGIVYPFDQYQGPFVSVNRDEAVGVQGGKLWLTVCDNGFEGYWFNDSTKAKSSPFPLFLKNPEQQIDEALMAAEQVIALPPQHRLCRFCEHFIETDEAGNHDHLYEDDKEFDHDAEPGGPAYPMATWKIQRPDLFQLYHLTHRGRKIGPNAFLYKSRHPVYGGFEKRLRRSDLDNTY